MIYYLKRTFVCVAFVSTDRIPQARQKGESMEKGKISAKQQEILEYIKNQILEIIHGKKDRF